MSKPIDGKCPVCGSPELMLARDKTEYSPCEWDSEQRKFVGRYSHMEESEAPDAVRFYCTNCGEYMEVPEELK